MLCRRVVYIDVLIRTGKFVLSGLFMYHMNAFLHTYCALEGRFSGLNNMTGTVITAPGARLNALSAAASCRPFDSLGLAV